MRFRLLGDGVLAGDGAVVLALRGWDRVEGMSWLSGAFEGFLSFLSWVMMRLHSKAE